MILFNDYIICFKAKSDTVHVNFVVLFKHVCYKLYTYFSSYMDEHSDRIMNSP